MYLPGISLATAVLLAATSTPSAAPLATPTPIKLFRQQNAVVRAIPYYDTKPPLLMAKRALESNQDEEGINTDQKPYQSLSARRNKFDWAASLDLASTPSPASSTVASAADSGSASVSSASALISARASTPEKEDLAPPTPSLKDILLEPKEYLQANSHGVKDYNDNDNEKENESTEAISHILLRPKEYLQPNQSSSTGETSACTSTSSSTSASTSTSTSTSISTSTCTSIPSPSTPSYDDDCDDEGPYTVDKIKQEIVTFSEKLHDLSVDGDEQKRKEFFEGVESEGEEKGEGRY